MTRAELCALRPEDIDLARGAVRIGPETVRLTRWATEAARELLARPRTRETLLGVSPAVFSMRISRAAARAGLKSEVGRYILRRRRESVRGRPRLRVIPGIPEEAPEE